MLPRKECNRITGVYRHHNIYDLSVRVTFRALFSLLQIPKFEDFLKGEDELQKEQEEEFIELKWQEKRLSRREIDRYQFSDTCKTDLQRKYHDMIVEESLNRSRDRKLERIFTYIHEDQFVPAEEEIEEDLELEQEEEEIEAQDDPKVAVFRKKPEMRFKGERGFIRWHIMAEFQPEIVLFTLKYRPKDQLLVVYPDFNCMKYSPYYLEVMADRKYMYFYGIERIFESIDKSETPALDVVSEELRRRVRELTLEQGREQNFQMPKKHTRNVFLFFEISSAKNFDYDKLSVHFEVSLPSGCKLIDGLLKASTHSSLKSDKGIWQFGYCHRLSFICSPDFRLDDCLEIYFHVISIDSWQRERTEGYTSTKIVLKPASEVKEILQCFREVFPKWWEPLERFFVGGRRKIDLKLLFGRDSGTKASGQLDRSGFKTLSTGRLEFKYSVVTQLHPDDIFSKIKYRGRQFRKTINKNLNKSLESKTVQDSVQGGRVEEEDIENSD